MSSLSSIQIGGFAAQNQMEIFEALHKNSKIVYYDRVMSNISVFLSKVGIRPSTNGFKYLRMAIKMVIEDESYLSDGITKTVYPKIAKYYGTTWSAVERCMRYTIMVTEEKEFIRENFYGYSHFSNKDFIALAAEYICRSMN